MTATDTDRLVGIYIERFGIAPAEVYPLAGAGSDRRYFTIIAPENAERQLPEKIIGTIGTDPKENATFVYLSDCFRTLSLPVPEVYALSADGLAYIQQHAGDKSLLDVIDSQRQPDGTLTAEASALVERTIRLLPRFQMFGGQIVDFSRCYPYQKMDADTVWRDLNYFKYCFLKVSGVEFQEPQLDAELHILADRLKSRIESADGFMLRDFQSRNVMISADEAPYVIDFQGGMRGPAEYDVASFLWQAKARFTDDFRMRMVGAYIDEATHVNPDFDGGRFAESLPDFVIFRMLQTLGAYGFRGWTERKPHFLQSIVAGVKGLSRLLSTPPSEPFRRVAESLPTLCRIVARLMETPRVLDLMPLSSLPDYNGLTVTVTSFSYKRGVPYDLSGNGGGYVFDCRAVHNPGRYAEYKQLTGMDQPVIDFLEENGEIFPFLDSVKELVASSVERYEKRGFTSLCVNFGCTGGQHRSVYSAKTVGHWISKTYPSVRVIIHHREQRRFTILQPSACIC